MFPEEFWTAMDSQKSRPDIMLMAEEDWNDIVAWVEETSTAAPREGAAIGGHNVEPVEEEGLLVHEPPAR